jgi:transposase
MTPEKLFHELLGLGLNWEVIESRFERESGTVFLEIRETAQLWETARCPQDGGLVFCYDHTELLTWRHLNVFQHHCQITCRLPRGKCRQCGHVFRVRPPWEGLSTHFTKEFEAFALLLMREMPVSKAADLVGETDTRLWRMLFRQVDAAYAQADFCQVCCVGVDEMCVRKGREYLSVFADLLAKRVIFATEGKDRETWVRFVEALEKHNGHRHAITQASMDMSRAYQAGVAQTCRNAQVVFDKFHVIKNANEAVDKVRKAEIKNLGTAKAYQMRLVLQDIYRSPDATTARHRFQVWIRWVRWVSRFYKTVLFASMRKLAQMVEDHLAGILAHWKWGVTNAFMEGLNSVFSATKRKARGYRSPTHLTTMLYLVAGKLRLPQF